MKHLANVVNQFWKRWRHEYLLELRESHRNNQGRSGGSPVAVDDIVLVHNEHQPRGLWKLARVKETIVGNDGRVTGAVLKLLAKDGQITLLRRPFHLLYPLEINCQIGEQTSAAEDSNSADEGEPKQVNEEVPSEHAACR